MWRPCTILVILCLLAGTGCKRAPTQSTRPQLSFQSPTPAPPTELWKEFSGDHAFAHVRKLVEIGPRPSGSERLEQARQYIEQTLQSQGWHVERQPFTSDTPRGPVQFTNLIARFGSEPSDTTQRVIVASHYDTKLYQTIRFVGANDGGSSTGALLELARVLALDPRLATQIELLFFDGEEAIQQFSASDGLYGSRYYARLLKETNRYKQFSAGIVWDMMGDRDLKLTIPPDSPPELARAFRSSTGALGLDHVFGFADRPILDDHIPLIQSKIPAIDLIDFDYMPWHTADDTLDKVAPESLQKIGAITLHYLATTLKH
jgi:glutaminyl-peptide cyclotransferase